MSIDRERNRPTHSPREAAKNESISHSLGALHERETPTCLPPKAKQIFEPKPKLLDRCFAASITFHLLSPLRCVLTFSPITHGAKTANGRCEKKTKMRKCNAISDNGKFMCITVQLNDKLWHAWVEAVVTYALEHSPTKIALFPFRKWSEKPTKFISTISCALSAPLSHSSLSSPRAERKVFCYRKVLLDLFAAFGCALSSVSLAASAAAALERNRVKSNEQEQRA